MPHIVNGGAGGSGDLVSSNNLTDVGNTATALSNLGGASTAYVNSLVAGIKWKNSVKVATTANGTLASSFENGDTVDGVVLATGDRILLKDQSTGSQNGIYIVAASGAPTRATDADAGTELVSATVSVEQGTANADKIFVCTTNAITIGVTSITFTLLPSVVGSLIAGNNLSDLTNASLARTALGLGTLATQSGTFSGTSSGANTGDQTIIITGDATGSGTGSFGLTLATVNGNVGTFTNMTATVNGKGLITAASNGAAPEVPLTFTSPGLTRTSNTITSDYSTGKSGGLTVYGDTATTGNLTLRPNFADTTTGYVNVLGVGISVPAGSAGVPSINFGSSNTGIYAVGGTINIAIAGGKKHEFGGGYMVVYGTGDGDGIYLGSSTGGIFLDGASGLYITANTNSTKRILIKSTGSVAIGTGAGALSTSATGGFLYIPTCAGPPSGTPDTITGTVPIIYNTTDHKLYVYDGGWKGGTAPGAWS